MTTPFSPKMKTYVFSTLLLLLILVNSFAFGQDGGLSPGKHGPTTTEKDGVGVLGNIYDRFDCGIGYAQASRKVTNRNAAGGAGSGLPVTLAIAGMPACLVIDKAYIWVVGSFGIAPAVAPGAVVPMTITNPLGNTLPFNFNRIGQDKPKCWAEAFSAAYRVDVTSAVTGNGNYTISIPGMAANDVDGITMFVIYKDITAGCTYKGRLVINDGIFTCDAAGEAATTVMNNIRPCENVAAANVSAFAMVSDFQLATHNYSVGGGLPSILPGNFHQFDERKFALTTATNSLTFSSSATALDCFSLCMAGLYYRTTTSAACGGVCPTPFTISANSNTPVCQGDPINLTANITPPGTCGFNYSWTGPNGFSTTTQNPTIPAAAAVNAGTYTVVGSVTGSCLSNINTTTTVVISPKVTPTFAAVGPYCAGATIPALPTSSNNATPINGTWMPAIMDNTTTTTYTFTPAAGACANSVTLTVTITPNVTPTFNAVGPFCSGTAVGPLPTSSTNTPAITGAWTPPINNTTTTTYLFTPTAGLCAPTVNLTITINPNITPTFTPIGAFCEGTTAPTLPPNSTNTPSISGNWVPPTVSNSASGTYVFTPTSGTCVTTTNMSITVNTAPPVVLPAIPAICPGATPPILPNPLANGTTGVWSPLTVNNTTPGNYTFTPTAGQCLTSNSVSSTINSVSAVALTTPAPFCAGTTAPILATPLADGTTGSWVPPTVNNTTSGSYTFTPTTGQCLTSSAISITVNPVTTPALVTPAPFCAGTTAPILPVPLADGTNGSWAPPTVSNTTSGSYTFTPAAGLCLTTAAISITVNPAPPVALTTPAPFCSGTAAPILATPLADGTTGSWVPPTINNTTAGTYTFTPTPGQCLISSSISTTITATSPVVLTPIAAFCAGTIAPLLPDNSADNKTGTWAPATIDNLANGTYVFTPDPGQCATSASITVNVTQKSTPTFTPIAPLCGGAASPTLQNPSSDSPSISGTWAPATVDNTTSGTYTFTPANGVCANSVIINITVGPPQPAQFDQLPPFCAGTTSPILLTTSKNGVTGTWAPAIVSNTASGNYKFTPDAGLCAETTDMNIVVTPKENPTFNPVGPYCKGDAIPLLLTTSNAPESVTGTWTPAIDNQNTATYTFTPNPSECANTAILNVVVNPATTPTFTAPAAFCAGSAAPTLPPVSGNNISGLWAPTPVDNMNSATYTFTPTAGQCAETTTLLVTVNSGITITANDVATCSNVPIQLDATGGGAGATYVWTPAAGLDNPTIANPKATVSTNTTYHVDVTSPTGCKGSADVDITIAAGLTITVNPANPNICAGECVTLTASGATNYTWSPSTGLSSSTGSSVSACPAVTTTYTIDGNTNGCTGQGTVTVTIGAPTPATFTQIPPLCSGTPAPILPTICIEGISGTWAPGVVDNTSSATYTFTPTAGACALGTVMDIEVNPTPILGTVTAMCDGTNTNYVLVVDLVGGTPSFTMTANAPSPTISGSIPASTWTSNPIASGTAYNLDFKDSKGCGPVNVTGIKNCNCATAVGTMTNTLIDICQGATASANYSATGENLDANDAKEFVLHTNAGGTLGTIITRSATPSFTFNAGTMTFGTTYYISAIVGNNSGGGTIDITDPCLAVAIGQPVRWNETPTATATNNGPLCIGDALNLIGTGTPANPSMQFDWTFPNNSHNTQQNPSIGSVTATDAGTYSLIVTSNNCPSLPSTTTVVVNAPPVAVPSSNSPICAGQTLNLNAQTVAGATYNWTNKVATNTQNPTIVNAQTTDAGTYTLEVVIGTCRSPKVDVIVTINAVPIISVDKPTGNVCAGSPVTITATGAGASGANYVWTDNGGGASTTGASKTASPNSNTIYTVTGTVNNCSSNATSTITVDPIPVITPQLDIEACEGVTIAIPPFVVTPAGGTTEVSWNSNPGLTNLGALLNGGLGNIPSFIATGSSITQSTIKVNATRNGCPSLEETILITVHQLQTPIVSSNSPVCEGDSLKLFSSLNFGKSYNWTYPNGQGNGTVQNPIIPITTQNHSGNYQLSMLDVNGCPADGAISVIINTPATPILTAVGPFCLDNTLPQALEAKVNNATVNGVWTGPGVATNLFTPSIAGVSSPTHTLTFTPSNGICATSNTLNLVVNPMPAVTLSLGAAGCPPLSMDLATDANMDLTTWSFGDGTTANDITKTGAISNVYNNSGFYDVTITNTLKGCSTTKTFTNAVEVYSDPVASFGVKEPLLYLTDPTVELTNSTTNAIDYSWNFGDNTTSTISNPTHTYEAITGTYTIVLTATSAQGCTDMASQTIQIKDQLLFFVPNTFTPDGDQHNNVFQPVFTSGFDAQNFTMYIYNRWGEIIFESHNVEVGWDGTYKGDLLKEGVYQWTMDVKDPDSDNKFNFQGHVFLVR